MTFESVVDAGVSFLDSVSPDWRTRIDADDLDLRDPAYCVLGQVFGGTGDDAYLTGRWALADWAGESSEYHEVEHGFDTYTGDYEGLRAEWLTRL